MEKLKSERVMYHCTMLVIGLVMMLLMGGSVCAQEDAKRLCEKAAPRVGPSEPTEKESGYTPHATKARMERSPLIERLHAARAAGEVETLQRLEMSLPKSAQGGDSAGATTLRTPTSISGPGDLQLQAGGGPQQNPHTGKQMADFGSDIHVRLGDPTTREWNQTMACDPDGNIYVAWQDDYLAKDYIQIYWSNDGGQTWDAYGNISNVNADLKEPCIAVGKGPLVPRLLLAYIVDDGVNIPVPEVATATLGSPNFTFSSVPVWSWWDGYAKPVITTDSVMTSKWYAYLTCEGIYDEAVNDIDVCSWRSKDNGATWTNETVVFGNSDDYAWLDPDISFGTSMNRVFIATYNDSDETIYCVSSDDYAKTYNTPIAVCNFTLYSKPANAVDPEVAAAINNDNVMLCCTRSNASYDVPGYIYSQDNGQVWGTFWPLFSSPTFNMISVALTANEGGGSWHMAYTGNHHVFHAQRPQDLSSPWTAPTTPVDDLDWASFDFPKKGITSNWKTDVAAIAWADYRDGYPDYDTYFDQAGAHPFMANVYSISESAGGSASLMLDAGLKNGSRNYIILGSVSGVKPGIPLPGGMAKLPLKWDFFTSMVISMINGPLFQNFMGKLDKSGKAKALFTLLPVTGAAGIHITFAYALDKPWNYTSNPVEFLITP